MIEFFNRHWLKFLIAGVLAVLGVAFFQSGKPGRLARQGDSLRIEYHGDTAAYGLDTLATDTTLGRPELPNYEITKSVKRERKAAVKTIKTGEARVANLTEQLHVAQPSAWLFVRPSYPIGGHAALEAGLGIKALGGRLEVGPELREKQQPRVLVSYQRDFRLR